MLNQTVMVGRLVEDPKQNENKCIIKMAVTRYFKNENGEYDKDIVPVTLLNTLAAKTIEYCHKDDLVGIKGRIQTNNNAIEIIAEKVTFLSSKVKQEDL